MSTREFLRGARPSRSTSCQRRPESFRSIALTTPVSLERRAGWSSTQKGRPMKLASLRPIVATLAAAAVCVALSPRTDAANKATRTFEEQLVATAVTGPSDGAVTGGRIDLVIERWSTDAER